MKMRSSSVIPSDVEGQPPSCPIEAVPRRRAFGALLGMTRDVAALVGCVLVLLVGLVRPAAADDRLTVLAGSAAPGLYEALEFVALGAGFYKREHLIVDKEYAGNASTAAQLVATGKADICSVSIEPLLQGYDKGLRLQAFLSRSGRLLYVVGVLDSSPIRTLAEFKGTSIGEISPASAGTAVAQSMLAGAGLRSGDVSYITIGFGAQALDALETKRVAGVAFPYLETVPWEVVGHQKMRYFRDPILSDIPDVGFAATPATLAAKADVLRRFSRALVEASFFIRKDPEAAAKLFVRYSGQQPTQQNLDTVTRELTLLEDDFPGADASSRSIGALPLGEINLYSRFLADHGLLDRAVPADAIITNQFIPYANDFDHRAVTALAKAMH
jgi:NitT/TauT family transport system substrate-binding protein